MLRFYLKLILLFLITGWGIQLLICMQPHDDYDLRTLVTPDNCTMPCFMGVRPGVTTFDEALAMLQSNRWVGNVEVLNQYQSGSTSKTIYWWWNDSAPAAFDITWADQPSWMREQSGLIKEINIGTSYSLADIWLMLGAPAQGGFQLITRKTGLNNIVYPERGFRAEGVIQCPITIDKFWNTPHSWIYFSSGENMGLYDPDYLSKFLPQSIQEDKLC